MRSALPFATLLIACCAHAHPAPSLPQWQVEPARTTVSPIAVPAPADDDPYLAVPRVLDALNRARAAQGAPPLRLDRALCAVAQQGPAVFFQYGGTGAKAEQRTAEVLDGELNRFRHVYLRKAAVVLAPPSLTAVDGTKVPPAMNPKMAYVGIAVEQRQQETAVVLIFAELL